MSTDGSDTSGIDLFPSAGSTATTVPVTVQLVHNFGDTQKIYISSVANPWPPATKNESTAGPVTLLEDAQAAPPSPKQPQYMHAINYLSIEAWRRYIDTHNIRAQVSDDGWITRPLPFAPNPARKTARLAAVRAIAASWGNGRLIGRGASKMRSDLLDNWLRAWHNGDLRTCYLIECSVAKPDPNTHPGGDDLATWRATWTAAAGNDEVPASRMIIGPWRSPIQAMVWSEQEISNYLLAANCRYVDRMPSMRRRRWANYHLSNDQYHTDLMALEAQKLQYSAVYGIPTYKPAVEPVDLAECLDTNLGITHWSQPALLAYIDQHDLGDAFRWDDLVNRVHQHRSNNDAPPEPADLTFTTAPVQPDLGGQHPKTLLIDQYRREWIFKPAPDPDHHFRPEVEHAAHQLARRWGYRTAHSRLITHDGRYGQAQRRHSVQRDLTGTQVDDIAKLTLTQLTELACEHVLDWALDNDDTHPGNMLLLTDGHIIGIDKGRAWRYYGGWNGLSGDESAHSNCQLIYTTLYRAVRRRLLPRHITDQIYLAVIAQAERMQRLPDTELAEHIRTAQANRPHYKPSWYQREVPGAPTTLDELITAATTRKNQLVAHMHGLWARLYRNAGWTLPTPGHTPGHIAAVNPDGHPIHAGLHSPYLHHAVANTRNWGTATFFDGPDLEDAHLLLWRERRPDGTVVVRGHGKVRGDARHQLGLWCAARTSPDIVRPDLPLNAYFHLSITGHLRARGYGWRSMLNSLLNEIQWHRQRHLNHVTIHADPLGTHQATVNMCDYYAPIVETLLDDTQDDPDPDTITKFPYTRPVLTFVDGVSVQRHPATRAKAAGANGLVSYTDDGDLQLTDEVNTTGDSDGEHGGQEGQMYLITLDTGEEIEYRAATGTRTPLAVQGQLQFTVPNIDNLATSLHRIEHQLAVMGLTLTPATATGLELFYWRHLAAVMRDRVDSNPGAHTTSRYHQFWQHVNTQPDTGDPTLWRTAFAHLVDPDTVQRFLDNDEHLPRFGHLDLRNPTQPCGKPYWNRIDVTDQQCESFQMPSLTYRTGLTGVLHNGNCLSSEARMLHLASWKPGLSTARDIREGSSAYVFTRLNQESPTFSTVTLYLRPQVMRRTTNYGYNEDLFGKIDHRVFGARFDLATTALNCAQNNEYLIKNHVTLLDDIEILVCRTLSQRAEVIEQLAALGITTLRGLPVEDRCIVGDWFDLRYRAFRLARASRRP